MQPKAWMRDRGGERGGRRRLVGGLDVQPHRPANRVRQFTEMRHGTCGFEKAVRIDARQTSTAEIKVNTRARGQRSVGIVERRRAVAENRYTASAQWREVDGTIGVMIAIARQRIRDESRNAPAACAIIAGGDDDRASQPHRAA